MDAGFFVRHWRKFFPNKDARVIDSYDMIRFMRELQKREARRHVSR